MSNFSLDNNHPPSDPIIGAEEIKEESSYKKNGFEWLASGELLTRYAKLYKKARKSSRVWIFAIIACLISLFTSLWWYDCLFSLTTFPKDEAEIYRYFSGKIVCISTLVITLIWSSRIYLHSRLLQIYCSEKIAAGNTFQHCLSNADMETAKYARNLLIPMLFAQSSSSEMRDRTGMEMGDFGGSTVSQLAKSQIPHQ